jgi:chromosome partitioning protein
MGLFSRQNDQDLGNGKVVALLNQKGGVGKTTMAFNTAHALATRGHKVLCIDMDPQANLSLLFGHQRNQTQYNIFHLLINSVRELKALHTPILFSEIVEHVEGESGGIDLLPAGQELSGFELSVAGISAPRQLIFKRFLEKNLILKSYDYVIIDGPPTLGLLVVNILSAAHGLIIPFQPDQFSHMGLEHFHEAIEDIEDMGITDAPKILGYIPNLVENRRKQVKQDFDMIRTQLQGAPVFEGFSNKVQLAKSGANKKSVFAYQSKDFKELQDKFLSMADHIHKGLGVAERDQR